MSQILKRVKNALRAQEDYITCAFCGGKGRDPFAIMSHLATCYVCQGRKTIRVQRPYVRCRYCDGTGISPMGGRNHCLACKGTGVVHRVGKTQECPVCEGKGIDGGTGLYCLECHGSGK